MNTPLGLGVLRPARALAVLAAAAVAVALLPAPYADAQTPTRADLVYACPDYEVPDHPFTDIEDNTFEDDIACLVYYGITAGRTPTLYDPGSTVTRAQMATFFARLIGYAEQGGLPGLPAYDGTNEFSDVTDATHLENINRLAQAGIVQGGPGGLPATQYGPDLPVTRSQMASFINRVQGHLEGDDLTGDDYGFQPADNATSFPDVGDATEPHTRNINAIASVGITQGDEQGNFNPGNATTRGQMAAFIMRHVDANVEAGTLQTPAVRAGEPVLEAIDPSSGTTGTSVTISGVNLGGTTVEVLFDGTAVPGTVNQNGTEVTAEVPELPGTGSVAVDVGVRVDGQASLNELPFLYQGGDTVEEGEATVESVNLVTDAPAQGNLDTGDVLALVFSQDVTGSETASYTFADDDGTVRTYNCSNPSVTGSCTYDAASTTLTINLVVAPSFQSPGDVDELQYNPGYLSGADGVSGTTGELQLPDEGVPIAG